MVIRLTALFIENVCNFRLTWKEMGSSPRSSCWRLSSDAVGIYRYDPTRIPLCTILLILDNCMCSLTKPFGNYSRTRYEISLRGNCYRSWPVEPCVQLLHRVLVNHRKLMCRRIWVKRNWKIARWVVFNGVVDTLSKIEVKKETFWDSFLKIFLNLSNALNIFSKNYRRNMLVDVQDKILQHCI